MELIQLLTCVLINDELYLLYIQFFICIQENNFFLIFIMYVDMCNSGYVSNKLIINFWHILFDFSFNLNIQCIIVIDIYERVNQFYCID